MIWLDYGTMRFEGVLMRADYPTMSGRTYPIGVVRRMLNEAMKADQLLVELGEASDDPTRVHLKNACGVIESVVIANDGVVTAKGRVLDTRKGRDLRKVLYGMNGGPFRSRVDLPVGLSVRSVGSVTEDGIVRDDARVIGVDMVEE